MVDDFSALVFKELSPCVGGKRMDDTKGLVYASYGTFIQSGAPFSKRYIVGYTTSTLGE